MLSQVALELDDWIAGQNRQARAEGLRLIAPCKIRVLGQAALLESGVRLTLAATRDVDVFADYEHAVETEFRRLLRARGRELDPLGHEAWMPVETEYSIAYQGQWVVLSLADRDSVLISKALKAPHKNTALLVEYLAGGPSARFLSMAKKYRLNLEQFL